MTHLYFCQWTRIAAIKSTNVYRDEFSSRLMPAFDNIDEEANVVAQEVWDAAMSLQYNGDEYYDLGMFADSAQEAGMEAFENLHFVKQQLLGLAVAGLYHLWERTLKQFISKEYRRHRLDEKYVTKLVKMDFNDLSEVLSRFGYDLSKTLHFNILNELRLVANTIKHGDGVSCDALATIAPDLFSQGHISYKDKPTFDDLELSNSDFTRYANGVEIFWTLFPDKLNLVDDTE